MRAKTRDVTVRADAIATGFSGAQYGTANTEPVDIKLMEDLQAELEGGYATWRDLGLEGVQFTPGEEATETDTEDGGMRHRNPATITFSYHKA